MQTCYIRKKWHGQKTVDLFFQPWSPHGATSTLTSKEEEASLTFVWATSGRKKARMGRPKPNECTQWRAYGLDPPAPPRGNRTPGKGISDALRSCQILLPSYIQRKQQFTHQHLCIWEYEHMCIGVRKIWGPWGPAWERIRSVVVRVKKFPLPTYKIRLL